MNQQDILKDQNARNNTNNAKAINAALDAASKSRNPYAKVATTLDKVTDGKVSELGGRAASVINKKSGLTGRMMQKKINQMGESGTTDRINKAANAKKGFVPLSASTANNGQNNLKGSGNGNYLSDTRTKETEEQASDGGGSNFRTSFKLVRYGLIAMIPVSFVIIIICLFTTASQIYINSIGLGNADSLSDSNAGEKIDKKIDKNDSDNLNREITDENANEDAYLYDEEFIKFRNSKLNKYNLVQVAETTTYLRRKYGESSLDELEDFYPDVVQYAKENDTDTVYDFFFKLYYVYQTYKQEYGVDLDLPLLMATLNIQSKDNVVIFSSNLSSEDKKPEKRSKKDFMYDADWSSYISTKDNSEHDIEVLAQHMVSLQVTEYCINSSGKKTQEHVLKDNEIGTPKITCKEGETYQTTSPKMEKDDAKYNEFLKEFIEKKYYLEDPLPFASNSINSTFTNSHVSVAATSFKKYNFTNDQLLQIASLCKQEQSTLSGIAAEASIMANLYEDLFVPNSFKSKYSTDEEAFYNWLRLPKGDNLHWFARGSYFMDLKNASEKEVEVVRKVLNEGKRTLPKYIDEHDSMSDIKRAWNGDTKIDKKDRKSYIQFQTKISNGVDAGSTVYTFYSFPASTTSLAGDPFGYTSEKNRQDMGECHYDFNTWQPIDCNYGENSDFVNSFMTWLMMIADDDSHGYDQNRRNGPDYDCSSLVYYGLLNSGFTTKQLGSSPFTTGDMDKTLTRVGFKRYSFNSLVPNEDSVINLQPGDILLKKGHTEVYAGRGKTVGAHGSECGDLKCTCSAYDSAHPRKYACSKGDQLGVEIDAKGEVMNRGWVSVYRYTGA